VVALPPRRKRAHAELDTPHAPRKLRIGRLAQRVAHGRFLGVRFEPSDEARMEVRVDLAQIMISETHDQQVIVLRERNGTRALPIVIGLTEALAIDRRVKKVQLQRPMTHDLLANVVEALGGELEKIVINDLQDSTFFAKLVIRRQGELTEIDSRPSDAIALGVAADTPIYVADHVLKEIS